MRGALVLLALLASSCATAGSSIATPFYTIAVHVNDADRRPIAGAIVAFDGKPLEPTGLDGRTVGRVFNGKHTLDVRAPGYQRQIWAVWVLADWSYGVSLEREAVR